MPDKPILPGDATAPPADATPPSVGPDPYTPPSPDQIDWWADWAKAAIRAGLDETRKADRAVAVGLDAVNALRDAAMARHLPPPPGCTATTPGFSCSRTAGHDGPHVHCGLADASTCARWVDGAVPPPSGRATRDAGSLADLLNACAEPEVDHRDDLDRLAAVWRSEGCPGLPCPPVRRDDRVLRARVVEQDAELARLRAAVKAGLLAARAAADSWSYRAGQVRVEAALRSALTADDLAALGVGE